MSPTETLNRLIEVCIDAEKRYRHAANDVGRDDLEAFFKQEAAKRKAAADELQAQRSRMGEVKEESGSFGGLLDRAEMDLSVIMSKGDSGVVEWCREDAEKAAAEYTKALNSPDLPSALRPILERQLAAIRMTSSELDRVLRTYGGPRS
ncbi:MAG TPA: PA2169 family four-helix-bundle protein [Candidatus Binataceae bacterium]|jgi:uncharacterized protein (TIGR02284 family)